MADAHSAGKPGESGRVEDVPDHAVGLALEEATFGATGDDAAGVLAAMLEKREALADLRSGIDRRVVEEESEDAAHCDPGSGLRAAGGAWSTHWLLLWGPRAVAWGGCGGARAA